MRRASSNRSRSSAADAAASRSVSLVARRGSGAAAWISATTSGSTSGSRRGVDVREARAVAASASSRIEPSSIHCSVERDSIRSRSIDGSCGARGPRRARTSAARRSASFRGSGRVGRSLRSPRSGRPPRAGPADDCRPDVVATRATTATAPVAACVTAVVAAWTARCRRPWPGRPAGRRSPSAPGRLPPVLRRGPPPRSRHRRRACRAATGTTCTAGRTAGTTAAAACSATPTGAAGRATPRCRPACGP